MCITGGLTPVDALLRSEAFMLTTGEHSYTVEGKFNGPNEPGCCNVTVQAARVIVEWTERR